MVGEAYITHGKTDKGFVVLPSWDILIIQFKQKKVFIK